MRLTSVKSNKKTMKVANKKPVGYRNRKADIKPPIRDTISETISFVIKGKLTPMKPILIKNKVDLIVKGNKTRKCGKIVKKTNKVATKSKIEAIKKFADGPSQVKTRVQMKTAKKPSAQSSCKRNAEKISVKATPRVPKKTAKPLKTTPITEKKSRVKGEKQSKAKKIRKLPPKKIKKQIFPEVSSEKKKEDEIKKQQTIEQLLKEVNEEMESKNYLRSKGAKSKIRVRTNRQAAAGRIKKRPASYETEDVSNDKPSDVTACEEKAIKAEVIDSPGELSDEIPLKVLSQLKTSSGPVEGIKTEPVSDKESSPPRAAKKKQYHKLKTKPKVTLMKKRVISSSDKATREEQRCKTKLFRFWNGPKRHRVASLNALAKVHCLYENETRGNIQDIIDESSKMAYAPKRDQGKCKMPRIKKESVSEDQEDAPSPPPTRTLRSVPGLRAVGKHWDMHDTSFSSEDEDNSFMVYPVRAVKKERASKPKREIPKIVQDVPKEKPRKQKESVMDLKDMVVCKRMASLNASAILAASYSSEKRPSKFARDFDDSSSYASASSEEYFAASDSEIKEEDVKKEDEDKVLDVHTPGSKVAVILNQDTDVTITGVYVNSTTRSTHHEGYCSIAGMQYRISATSHTQTAATAVATETLLQPASSSAPDNSNSDSMPSTKSYTPLDALSNMKPPPGPGIQHNHPVVHGQQNMGPPHVLPMPAHQMSPGLHHSCSSAFSSPHSNPNYQIPPGHHPPMQGEPGYIQAGYYQPAGPLITVPHGHGPPPPNLTKSSAAPLSEASPTTSTTPSVTSHEPPPPPPSSNGDSSDSEVIITSVTTAKDSIPFTNHPHSAYRYPQYSAAPPGYSYSYPPPYHYPNPPPPNPSYAHHDLCYSPNPYVHKYSPYRSRYVTSTQYYPPPNPQEMYGMPPSGPSQQSQQVVTATPVSVSPTVYPPPPGGPPLPTLMETYPAPQPPLVETYQPPPPHYYPTAYGPAPPCYTHSPSRAIPYINATYQSCPCPMQSCPKNVLTGPLTGDSKRSNISSISKDSMPLPPVALALPFEPTSATGPPSPARGSAGMPPPLSASPAGATYQPPPPPTKQESHASAVLEEYKIEKKRKARVGKAMVRNNIAANMQNTMLLMCNPNQNYFGAVKREIESPKEKELVEQKKEPCTSEEEAKIVAEDLPLTCTKIEQFEKTEAHLVAPIEPKEEKNRDDPVTGTINHLTVEELVEEVLQPVVSTVAENVKVKNMKRTLSMSKDQKVPDPEVAPSPKKKQKLGSYKCLIKRESSAIRIHNGKRRLIEEAALGPVQTRNKIRVVNLAAKRKLDDTKKATTKRSRLFKHLTVDNFPSEPTDEAPSKETEEPSRKKAVKKPKGGTKSAPAVLDHLFAKNNVERIIESVVSDGCVRTTQESGGVKTADKYTKTSEKCARMSEKCVKTAKEAVTVRKSTNNKTASNKTKSEVKKIGAGRRKSKCKAEVVPQVVARVPRRSFQMPRWSNGWIWEGEPYEAKVFINSDDTTQIRRCYPAMRHKGGDKIVPRDCVLLKAGPRKNDLPFVAKIASLWENPEDGEMMMSLLWYYRPEHTEQGRLPVDQQDEVFASRHKDSNSVACIDDKCYVLTFNEYCRYRKICRRIEAGLEEPLPCIPNPEPYPRTHRQPPPSQISPDMVFFCRRVYDFRQKRIMKNPT